MISLLFPKIQNVNYQLFMPRMKEYQRMIMKNSHLKTFPYMKHLEMNISLCLPDNINHQFG